MSTIKRIVFLNDWMYNIVFKRRWCDVFILSAYAPSRDKE
jgi:hypothetical protein